MKYLQKFPFINESRSQELSEEKFKEILETNCKNWSLDNTQLYRGVQNKNPLLYINPGVQSRQKVSIDNDDINIYGVIFSNSKHWSKFPDRNNSLIAATDLGTVSDYAQWSDDNETMLYYVVIPFDDTKWGISPKDDLWFSYEPDILGVTQLQEFNNSIMSTLRSLSNNNHIRINVISDLKEILDLIDWSDKETISKKIDDVNSNLKGDSEYGGHKYDDSILSKLLTSFNNCNNSEEALDNILNSLKPDRFDVQSYGNEGLKLDGEAHECWSTGECLMIRRDFFEKMFRE